MIHSGLTDIYKLLLIYKFKVWKVFPLSDGSYRIIFQRPSENWCDRSVRLWPVERESK